MDIIHDGSSPGNRSGDTDNERLSAKSISPEVRKLSNEAILHYNLPMTVISLASQQIWPQVLAALPLQPASPTFISPNDAESYHHYFLTEQKSSAVYFRPRAYHTKDGEVQYSLLTFQAPDTVLGDDAKRAYTGETRIIPTP